MHGTLTYFDFSNDWWQATAGSYEVRQWRTIKNLDSLLYTQPFTEKSAAMVYLRCQGTSRGRGELHVELRASAIALRTYNLCATVSACMTSEWDVAHRIGHKEFSYRVSVDAVMGEVLGQHFTARNY